jgi:RNA polymerase sigma-70 factor (ECF subfamily)
LTVDHEHAADAVQEAFARAIRGRMSFGGDARLETWLWRTLVNVCADDRRRTRPPLEGAPPEVAAPPSNGHAERAELRAAIAALPERQRLILFLRHYADLDYETIAGVAGVERGTVAATLHQAHRSLSRTLKEVPR